ncbi:DUF1488 family protein [Vibrio aphrogenes]|uniref:DUF1488 domain-containing protein n=1 Tax=Vibrio aphrogenes TaxID=1891186 RepID=UPI000B361ACF|nr:DUF1488 domain-containing protein [Vibrio aphrogenes]
MNQNILFTDQKHWDDSRQCVVFFAQQSGQLIACSASLSLLSQLDHQTLSSEKQALEAFQRVQFDLEELAEQAIEDEAFSPSGEIDLG